ncbi:MAG: hypothetical protein HYX97_00860 [Chloroflexi bacterium]|nr:hypothetical protein [Chloroflexota bacterium]
MRKPAVFLSLAAGLLLSACGGGDQPPTATPSPTPLPVTLVRGALEQWAVLPLGHALVLGDEGLVIRFVAVEADSRCPRDVQCVWAGEARVRVEVTREGRQGAVTVVLTEPGGSSKAKTQLEGYTVEHRLGPYPEAGKSTRPEDYRLSLRVSKA